VRSPLHEGGSLLSNYYVNGGTKLRWRCAEGHEWEAIPASVKRGTWCPICGDRRAAIKRANTIEHVRVLAAAKGGVCLSESYNNVKSRLQWRCAAGHEWETQAAVIIGGHWCPKCEKFRLGRKYALSLKDIQKTATERRGECLSSSYLNVREKLTWHCAKGHIWRANANSIRRGSWCPICAGKRPKSSLNGGGRIDVPPQLNPFAMAARESAREKQTEML
jgi:Zn finger protein HypA/HybF involved in hydrogenase expression